MANEEKINEILERKQGLIWERVWRFRKRNSGHSIDPEDQFQEAMLCFSQFLKNCKTEEELERVPFWDITHVLTEQVIRSQQFHFPVRTSDFKKYKKKNNEVISFDDAFCTSQLTEKDIDLCLSKETVRQFANSLSDSNQDVFKMKMKGYRYEDIARMTGLGSATVARRMKEIKKDYKAFVQ